MAERLKNVPLWYKAASLVIVGLLAACGVDEKLELTPVMTIACSPAQDTLPYATNFRAGASAPLGGEITETSQISPAEIQSYQSEVEKAIACSPYREAIEAAGGSLQTLLIRLEDEEGNKQDAIFLARVGLGGETIPFTVTTETGSSFEVPFFFYSDSKDAFFAPPGQGDTDKPGVLLPIRAWVEGETGYWAFRIETSNATQPLETDSYLFRRDFRTGIVTLREPYSGREYQWKENPQQTTSAMYRVISQSTLMPEGWVDVNGTPVSPEFLSLQEEIAQSENFTLTPNGLEVKLSDGTIVEAAGVAVQPDGTLTITIDGQKKPVTEIEVADNQLLLKAAGGETYTFSQEGQLIPTYPISEAREFVPANDIEFVENLPDYNLKLAPDADREAIYWDIIVSHLGDVISKSKGMEANRAVYEEIIKDHPEWEGIGHSWDYKVRVEFMKEFLKRTGGWMIVTDMNFNKYEANLNEKIKLEVVQVTELPKGFLPELPLNDSDSVGKGAGTGMYVNDKGQIVYSVAMVGDTLRYTLNEDERSIFNTTNWTDGEVISELFRNLIASTATHSRTDYKVVPATNHKLYVKGSDPDSQGYFLDVTWTFIK